MDVNRWRWWWDRYEGPTWVVAAVIYASWAALTLLHADLPWWLIVPLGALRTFIEHRSASVPGHRTAIIENDLPFGMLFLYNNLHAIHHAAPALPWYELRARWRARRIDILAKNGNFHFPGYWDIVGRWFVRPVFIPRYDGERPR